MAHSSLYDPLLPDNADTVSVSSDSDSGPEISLSGTTTVLPRQPRRELKWYQKAGDFLNCLKAFIGTNYQALPFAFHNSGLGLGILGVLLIATLTDHCVLLLVRCKAIIIDRVCKQRLEEGEIDAHESHLLRKRLEATMGYGDIGKRSLGVWCFHFIQVAVWFTQFMTVMSYYIFIGNTVYAMFPVRPVPYIIHNGTQNGTHNVTNTLAVEHTRLGHGIPMLHMHNSNPDLRPSIVTDLKSAGLEYNEDGYEDQGVMPPITFVNDSENMLRRSRDLTEVGSEQGPTRRRLLAQMENSNFMIIGPFERQTDTSHFPTEGPDGSTRTYQEMKRDMSAESEYTTESPEAATDFLEGLGTTMMTEKGDSITDTATVDTTSTKSTPASINRTTTTGVTPATLNTTTTISTTTTNTTTTTGTTVPTTSSTTDNSTNATTTIPTTVTTPNFAPTDAPSFYMRSTAPDLRLVILFPLPFFILTSMIRKVRYIAPFSTIATAALFGGAFAVLGFIVANFKIADFEWYNIKTLPLFLGQLIGAYEGIGCVIPIQSSMEGNRHMFPWFLHGAIAIVFCILCSFGILGYLTYGDDVEQIILLDIPQHSYLALAVDVTLIISVLFTYPLQCFPVIDILETYIFSTGKCCGPPRPSLSQYEVVQQDEESDEILARADIEESVEQSAGALSAIVPSSVPAWKRNTLRLILTLICVGLAIVLKDAYAYTASFTGALGASSLAFIFPCLIHLNLEWPRLSVAAIVKDVAIIAFAVVASVLTMVSLGMLIYTDYKDKTSYADLVPGEDIGYDGF